MILDTSALAAIFFAEPDAPRFAAAIAAAAAPRLSAATAVELAIVVGRRAGFGQLRPMDLYLERTGVHIVPFTADQARVARRAYQLFGRASGHPARLNFGDCFAYALAKLSGEPLLYKGGDFALTDLASAL